MKKLVSMAAVVAFLFTMNVNAAPDPKGKKKVVKTEKSCTAAEKKACSKDKAACCAAKKAEAKK